MRYALFFAAALALVPLRAEAALSPEQVAKRGLSSVVVVRAEKGGRPLREASGFFVDKGVLATLGSVVEGAEVVRVRVADEEGWLEVGPVVARDKQNDLILLELKQKGVGRGLSFAREDPSIGQTVYAIGSPPKTKGVFHRGLVSGIVENQGQPFVQMDAYVPKGAEGGPLLDEDAQVVGVVLPQDEGARFSYAVPGSLLRALKEAPRRKDPLAGVSMPAAAAFERGAKAERERRWSEAEAAFREALRLEPTLRRAEKHVARALAAQERLPEAAALFIAYLAAQPDDHDALFELAEVQRKRGRLSESFDLYSRYLTAEQRPDRREYLTYAQRVVGQLTRSFERRAVLLAVVDEAGADATRAEVAKQLVTRLDAKAGFDLVSPDDVPLDALPKNDASCRGRAACIWKPAWARWVIASKLVPPPDGAAVAIELELFDVRAKKRVATATVRSQGGGVLPLDIDDGLSALVVDLPAELVGTLKRGEGGSGRRPLLLDDDSAPPATSDGDFQQGQPVASSSTSTPTSPPTSTPTASSTPRRSLRDVEADAPTRDERRIAAVAEKSGRGFPVVPWLLITGGVTLAGAGLAFDLLSPSSANYAVGALDFIGPAAIGLGAAVVIGGVVMGPFGGADEEG